MTESLPPPPPPSLTQDLSSIVGGENTLSSLRAQIDALDTQILSLLNQRALLVDKIGKLKKKERLTVYSPGREEQLLRRLGEQNKGPLSTEAIRAIYREILSVSRATEKELVIACLVSTGDYQAAAMDQFGSSAKYVFFKEVADIFKQISENKVDYGVIPMEETELKGVVLNSLMQTDLHVCAKILSSPSAVSGKRGSGVWFLVVGKGMSLPSGFDDTLIVLCVEDKPNALANTLELLKKNQISHLDSWAVSKDSKDIFFLVEVEGHFNQLQASGLLRKLSQQCRAVKILGSYPVVKAS